MTATRVFASTVVAGLALATLTVPGSAVAAQGYPDRKLNGSPPRTRGAGRWRPGR
ncbi:hypothetical protein [Micromonospora humida]